MTQTIHTPNGHNAVWIEADYGQGRRGAPRLVGWDKITLAEFLENLCLDDVDYDQQQQIKHNLSKFVKGYAWIVTDGDESEVFSTAKEARDWAYSQFC